MKLAVRPYILIILALITVPLTHVIHARLDAIALPQPEVASEALPSIGSLQLVSLVYASVVADYYWMRALDHFGTGSYNELGYPLLEPLLRRSLALDPYFKSAYTFAGAALTLPKMDPRKANALLEQGMQYRPDVWQIPYFLGFNLYYFQQDYARAAEILGIAAKHPDAPDTTAKLATRLAAQAGRPEVGIQLIDSILERTNDEQLRASYMDRRRALQLDVEQAFLNRLIVRYRDEHGAIPTRIDQLIEAHYLSEPPNDPYGKPYFITHESTVSSASDNERLRLKRKALGASVITDDWHPPLKLEDQPQP